MTDHPILTAVGVGAVGLGVLLVVQPGLAAAVGADYVAVTVVGLLAVVQAVRVVQRRRSTEIRGAATPDVETVETVPTPGEAFDDRVAGLGAGARRTTVREREDIREHLTETAVTAVAHARNCSPATARERIEAGEWTDDRYAAAFLAGPDGPRLPFRSKLRFVAGSESLRQHQMRRTADAVARVAGVGDDADAREGSR
ncbi:DUF7269 family protein [Halorussus marinus]|uniref:DUF7269 family protein n=1 Tax=Halorussus marinus TaxID=2505976 RepID=UPI001093117E|nr:hypothetical protein [Halorussus marinus]